MPLASGPLARIASTLEPVTAVSLKLGAQGKPPLVSLILLPPETTSRFDVNVYPNRGPAGRFVTTTLPETPRSQTPSTLSETSSSNPDTQSTPGNAQIDRSVHEVGYGLDLTKLCFSQKHHGPGIVKTAENGESVSLTLNKHKLDRETQDPRTPLYEKHSGFIGESWYASFLLRASNHENDKLRQYIPYEHDQHGQTHEPGGANSGLWQKPVREQLPDDLPPQALRDGLVEAYFTRFHVLYPILNKTEFLLALRDGYVPIVLLRCVLFIASVHCDMNILHRMSFESRADAKDDLFTRARRCLDEHPEETRCLQMMCSFLLHFWFGQPYGIRDPMWWLAIAVRLAESIGMHRSIDKSHMALDTKAHWKRVWWCLYIRDRQVSLSAGTPSLINDLDCDVEELTLEDFPDESEATARYVMAQANLSRIGRGTHFEAV
ncbi:hypothetical protein A1O1_01657 [Capronia coronata CBS 617.96]|uniref:Xylanolytic transcriptional activator regulatory domain-containing protein n=1 Tax=Capronia coronata CBS 617.96 TaxID=1182541 RepID=W9YU92_9EURO|nr:uncharacterized protein A1O1_01657 [Capronia coronata CBS 617.96]EXJ93265.1 hypothetical protein A1O1_01657 [Capronia coronata CBS 617.96]